MDAEQLRRMLQRIKEADTPENEARLKQLVEERGARLERTRGRNPQQYRLVLSNGSLGSVTLAEVEDWLAKMGPTGTP